MSFNLQLKSYQPVTTSIKWILQLNSIKDYNFHLEQDVIFRVFLMISTFFLLLYYLDYCSCTVNFKYQLLSLRAKDPLDYMLRTYINI